MLADELRLEKKATGREWTDVDNIIQGLPCRVTSSLTMDKIGGLRVQRPCLGKRDFSAIRNDPVVTLMHTLIKPGGTQTHSYWHRLGDYLAPDVLACWHGDEDGVDE